MKAPKGKKGDRALRKVTREVAFPARLAAKVVGKTVAQIRAAEDWCMVVMADGSAITVSYDILDEQLYVEIETP